MSESTERMQTVARLWQEHREAPFPESLRRAQFWGTDVWPIDLSTAGCILAWLGNRGTLDSKNSRILQSCVEDLDRIIPEIKEPEAAEYCRRLHQLALLVSRNLPSTT